MKHLLTILTALALTSATGAAQENPRSRAFSINAGIFEFDLSGTGSTEMLAFRVDLPVTRTLLVEPSLSGARPEQQFGARTTFLVVEALLQLQLSLGRVAPYLGLGGGLALDIADEEFGGTDAEPTVAGAAGIRWWAGERVGLRAELRVRGIGTRFQGSAAEYTLGLMWRP